MNDEWMNGCDCDDDGDDVVGVMRGRCRRCSGREMICAMCHVERGREEVRDGMRKMLMIPYRIELLICSCQYIHILSSSVRLRNGFQHKIASSWLREMHRDVGGHSTCQTSLSIGDGTETYISQILALRRGGSDKGSSCTRSLQLLPATARYKPAFLVCLRIRPLAVSSRSVMSLDLLLPPVVSSVLHPVHRLVGTCVEVELILPS